MSATLRSRKIAAFFDIDGTLLPAPSLEWRFASWLETYGALGLWQMARWSTSAASSLLTGDFGALRLNKTYLAALPTQLARDWEGSLAPTALTLFSQAAERIAWHLQQDHRVFLISGTLAPLAEIFGRTLRDDVEAHATNLEVGDGNWTGAVAANHMSGAEKASTLIRIANHCGISLAESFAYGNEMSDIPMLESVGNPIAVNPGRRLRRIAAQRNWQIARWNSGSRDHFAWSKKENSDGQSGSLAATAANRSLGGRSFSSDINSAHSSGVSTPEAMFGVCASSSLAVPPVSPSRNGAR